MHITDRGMNKGILVNLNRIEIYTPGKFGGGTRQRDCNRSSKGAQVRLLSDIRKKV